MKPVLILQNLSADGPAYLARWLREHGPAFEVFDNQAGPIFPDRIEPYAALAILGGEMSANDPLPSLRRAEDLFRQALAFGVPTTGHCLGGQLMARAMGARIGASPAPRPEAESGWCRAQAGRVNFRIARPSFQIMESVSLRRSKTSSYGKMTFHDAILHSNSLFLLTQNHCLI